MTALASPARRIVSIRLLQHFHLDIAAVRFLVNSELPVLHRDSDGCYGRFVHSGASKRRDSDISVSLRCGGLPDTAPMQRLFTAGDAWTMYRDGTRRYVALAGSRDAGPVWVAQLERGFHRITIHCGPRMCLNDRGIPVIANPLRYPLDQLLMMYALSQRRGLVVHAAGAVVDGAGLVFAGRSGAGKSTLAYEVGSDFAVLSDDRVVVRERRKGRFEVHGTPWPGEAGMALNRGSPLGACLFLVRRRSGTGVRRLTAAEALERLLPVASVPWYDAEVVRNVLPVCDALVASVPAFEIFFNRKDDLGRFLRGFVRGLARA